MLHFYLAFTFFFLFYFLSFFFLFFCSHCMNQTKPNCCALCEQRLHVQRGSLPEPPESKNVIVIWAGCCWVEVLLQQQFLPLSCSIITYVCTDPVSPVYSVFPSSTGKASGVCYPAGYPPLEEKLWGELLKLNTSSWAPAFCLVEEAELQLSSGEISSTAESRELCISHNSNSSLFERNKRI